MPNRVYADTNQTQMLVRAITQYAHVAEIDTFTVDTAGWTGASGGAVSQSNKQLVVAADHVNEATLRSYSTQASQKYQLLLDLDHGDCDSLKVEILDSASTVIASYSNVATSLSYQFTAVNSETNVKVSRQDKNGQNISTFYLNSAVLSEIRDTLYQDTIHTATGNGYRFAFNGQERDDEFNGVGNSYTAMYWQYDPRLGRRWNVDPIVKDHESPYAALANNPIWFLDPNGADTIRLDYTGCMESITKCDGENVLMMYGKYQLNSDGEWWRTETSMGLHDPRDKERLNKFSVGDQMIYFLNQRHINHILWASEVEPKSAIGGVLMAWDQSHGGILDFPLVLKNDMSGYNSNGSYGGLLSESLKKAGYDGNRYASGPFFIVVGQQRLSNGKYVSRLYNTYDMGQFLWGHSMQVMGVPLGVAKTGANVFEWHRLGDDYYDQRAISHGYNFHSDTHKRRPHAVFNGLDDFERRHFYR